MLAPKRTKYRRPHRRSYKGVAKGKNNMTNGKWGLMALEGNYIKAVQIEAFRVAVTRYMRRMGKLWVNIFPHLSRTVKPLEVRMGSGKGAPDHWVAVVKKNKIIAEIDGVSDEIAREALRLGMHKLPIKTKIVSKEQVREAIRKRDGLNKDGAKK